MSRTEVAPATQTPLKRNAGLFLATCLIIANVIGSGIYTTPGFLARDLGSPVAVLGIWIIGAVLAFAGALSYSELGAMFPEAGGEYVYLREAFGSIFGFLTGWASFIAGFSAPIGAATIGFAAYLSHLFPSLVPENVFWTVHFGPLSVHLGSAQMVALIVLWALSLAHITGTHRGVQLQVLLTVTKAAAIAVLMVAGFWLGRGDWANFHSGAGGILPEGVFRNGSVSLIFVLFSFSGWNAAAYIAGEVRQPHRTLPAALITGTAIVTAIYVGLNMLFLYALGIEGMSGVLQVGEKASVAVHCVFGMDLGVYALGPSGGVVHGYCDRLGWIASVLLLEAAVKFGVPNFTAESIRCSIAHAQRRSAGAQTGSDMPPRRRSRHWKPASEFRWQIYRQA